MSVFHFRQFDVDDHGCGMKICSDSVTFGAWFLPPHSSAATVVDVGAGSGLLSLMAAQRMLSARITGLESDPSASAAARTNFEKSPWGTRLNIVEGDFADYTPDNKVDIILSNPPFFTTGMLAPDSSRASARHENSLTAAALFAFSKKYLKPDGHLGVILPADRTDNAVFEAELAGLKLRRMCTIVPRTGKPAIRTLFDFSPADGHAIVSTLTVRKADGILSDEYIALVEPFYMKIS